jgi:hypothetical protein
MEAEDLRRPVPALLASAASRCSTPFSPLKHDTLPSCRPATSLP